MMLEGDGTGIAPAACLIWTPHGDRVEMNAGCGLPVPDGWNLLPRFPHNFGYLSGVTGDRSAKLQQVAGSDEKRTVWSVAQWQE